mmetsp:Transcript_17757/g.30067  ORF Transcript_17757/g.30067 Transcript_17757/m.30067 type:complete len:294 (+) Transcript_17757:281-1162(+)
MPIMAANMDTVGTFEIAEAFSKHKMITCLHKHYSVAETVEWGKRVGGEVLNNVAITAGVNDRDFKTTQEILQELPEVKFICLDVANGYQHSFIERVAFYREQFPEKIILAGNVVTQEITQILLQAGADIVKIGIGPGSVCTTRKQTGVGYPQLSTVLENSQIAHSLGGYVISDGGCTIPGDFSKAFCAGADFVMAGGIFAGHQESGGETIKVEESGKWFKKFYGMSSDVAMTKYSGGVANYRASEGKLVYLPFKGPIESTILDLLGGVRSTCTYIGAQSIEEMPENTTFIKVT